MKSTCMIYANFESFMSEDDEKQIHVSRTTANIKNMLLAVIVIN